MKRLALFLDGTWNDPKDQTNVCRLRDTVRQGSGASQVAQEIFYETGVGTHWFDHLAGGAFGVGLSTNVQSAYKWLVDKYVDGDEIYLFGFSRGAYTARSVAGLIAKCGLLRKGAPLSIQQVYDRYQLGKDAAPIYTLDHIARHQVRPLSSEEQRLLEASHRVHIRMIGVWDTVGALGIPWNEAPVFGPRHFYFHNTNPSVLYENAFQALAIDEHRGPYAPTLWTKFIPDIPDPSPRTPSPGHNTLEQRWFVGAHSDVGGGYANDPLHIPPLAWMQQKAIESGLDFTSRISMAGDEIDTPPTDSFAAFMKGIYKAARLGKPFYRPIGAAKQRVNGGWSTPINEWIDASVFERWRRHPSYRPPNLEDWVKRKGTSPDNTRSDCPA